MPRTASQALKDLLRGRHEFGVNVDENLVHNPEDTQAAITLYDRDHNKYRMTIVRLP